MAKKKSLSRPAKVFWGLLAAVVIAITGIWGYNRYMQKKKVDQLYQHGFQLLEEQIATYIKENYSGVSKIEFSPIFISGDGQHSFLNLDVVPVVYDEYGNRALLGRKIGNTMYGRYGFPTDFYVLELGSDAEEIIYLASSRSGEEIDVSDTIILPEEAKLGTAPALDDNIFALIDNNQLKGIEKNSEGSPDVEIVYNLEIKKGDYAQWH
ncbi:hypothetical protein AB3329_07445 [Streptococcus sp. H31]|uniref:hypothetical protein n=1 Tax=Streptococcus huangxiaojuni TaxID=3237239 RepID=UPI0034A55E4D